MQKIRITGDIERLGERPDPAWVRGDCPECGEVLVSHLYYKYKEGYVIQWECWASRGEEPKCGYKKVL